LAIHISPPENVTKGTMDFANRLGIRKNKTQWPNSKECVGEKLGEIQQGKHICWQPTGRAEDAWNDLRPQIKDFLNHCGGSSLYLIMLEMYMIGRTEDTSIPTILIYSEDRNTRRNLRKAIKESGILTQYEGIGLVTPLRSQTAKGSCQSWIHYKPPNSHPLDILS
jgi:hypothetical protein